MLVIQYIVLRLNGAPELVNKLIYMFFSFPTFPVSFFSFKTHLKETLNIHLLSKYLLSSTVQDSMLVLKPCFVVP